MAIQLIEDDKVIQAWKPKPLERMSDGGGLFLLAARVAGRRHAWRLDYTFERTRVTLSLGVYPKVDLPLAREKALEIQKLVARNIDPREQRKEKRAALVEALDAERRLLKGDVPKNCFEDVARRWYTTRESDWMDSYGSKVIRRLERHVFPFIGVQQIASIEPPEILEVCRRVESQGTLETAHRALEHCSNVFRFGIAEHLLKADPCRDLRGALKKPVVKHFAAITKPRELADLLKAIHAYSGSFVTRSALQLAPMLFLRPGEFRQARWDEFDLDNAMWFVPSQRMKRTKVQKDLGEPHFVPLPRQAIAILEELYCLTGKTDFVFPAEGRTGRSMSDGTVNAALKVLGYTSDIATGHGFRATARTLLREALSVDREIIELQLAHEVKDANGRAYNRAEFLDARKVMMQKWADYLDDLREGRSDYRTHAELPEFVPVTKRRATQSHALAVEAR